MDDESVEMLINSVGCEVIEHVLYDIHWWLNVIKMNVAELRGDVTLEKMHGT